MLWFSLSKWDKKAGKWFFWQRIYWNDRWTPFCTLTKRDHKATEEECYWQYRHGDLVEFMTDMYPWWKGIMDFIRDLCGSMWYSMDTTEYDMAGRIIKPGPGVTYGHSVCNSCGKDMPSCWDVVCHKCKRTYCYECSQKRGGYWYCLFCERGIGVSEAKSNIRG